MSNSSITLRQVFEVPESAGQPPPTEGWKTFQANISREFKGIKTAALPDVAAKIGELFDIPIPNVLLASWKKADALQAALDESEKNPEAIMDLELAEHTVNSQHHPRIEVKIRNATVKNIEFTMRLAFKLKGFVLRIQQGVIKEMQTGKCEVKGTVEYQGLTILEKKLAPIELPGSISFHNGVENPAHEQ